MGEMLGLGCSHAPHLQFRDEEMSNVLRRTLKGDKLPAELKDPANWPEGMRTEWGDDEGLTAAHKHRAALVEGYRAARAAIDEFKPDFILIFGDDQYENFKLDIIPPFCVYALGEIEAEPFKASAGLGASSNVWNKPTDTVLTLRGHQEAAIALTDKMISRGFDVSCAYQFNHAESLNHAFMRTVLYLDYDMKGFDYPIVPFHVNCYGIHMRVPAKDRPAEDGHFVPPPAPPPWRCYDLGKEIARAIEESPWRVVVIGSSSWSHATLTRKHHFLYPDIETDGLRMRDLRSGDLTKWRDLTSEELIDAGQHEFLNWICLAGAMEGRHPEIVAHVQTYLFNSGKAVVLFPEA